MFLKQLKIVKNNILREAKKERLKSKGKWVYEGGRPSLGESLVTETTIQENWKDYVADYFCSIKVQVEDQSRKS